MDGYKISYISSDGENKVTFFCNPESSMDISKMSKKDIVIMMFNRAHPNCKIVSVELSSLEDYKNK